MCVSDERFCCWPGMPGEFVAEGRRRRGGWVCFERDILGFTFAKYVRFFSAFSLIEVAVVHCWEWHFHLQFS